MPLNSSGTYVSLSATTRQEIGTYVANLIRQGTTDFDQIALAIGKRLPGCCDYYDELQVRAIVRNEQKAIDLAGRMEGSGSYTPSGSEIPSIPGDPGRAGQYEYTVVVVATSETTGDTHTDRFEIYSSNPLSADDIQERIDANRDYYLRQIRSPAPKPGTFDDLTLDTYVIGAGRVR